MVMALWWDQASAVVAKLSAATATVAMPRCLKIISCSSNVVWPRMLFEKKKSCPKLLRCPPGVFSEQIFMKIKLHAAERLRPISSNFRGQYSLASTKIRVNVKREGIMS
jgi:hypothetical protein